MRLQLDEVASVILHDRYFGFHDLPDQESDPGGERQREEHALEYHAAATRAVLLRSRTIASGPTIASARIGGGTENGRGQPSQKAPAGRINGSPHAADATPLHPPPPSPTGR